MTRPVIGVTTSRRSGWRVFPLLAFNIWLAGGRAVRWGNGYGTDIDHADGIIVGGGDDISPDFYGGHLVSSARLDPDRDRMERDLVHRAFELNKPILGICRGAQMLNVALGGTLHQDAYSVYDRSDRRWTVLPRKSIEIVPGSRLEGIAGPEGMRVNVLHTQSVDRLGVGIRVAARDTGGMIQAVERVTDPFALGVQWHPEHLFYAHRQRAIFRALVAAAAAGQAHRAQIPAVEEHVG
ncbi:gamma-glutamyl-gamma-aminobutyrate hydrolase family protein [Rhodovulum sp. YNF3179]|uniref:gamma-glutamyl-gamma-aminobutyrate hydrolase family protein n=1 Tax=Rhodovulum sp. YNF3179 TaxID=3425127 RepID=UPI003D33CB7A